MAQIVLRDGVANEEEEVLLELAETLSDDDLEGLREKIVQLQLSQSGPALTEIIDTQTVDSNWPNSGVETAAGPLAEVYGAWAHKLGALGLVSQSVHQSQHHYQADSERYIDEDGTVTKYVFSVTFYGPCLRLAALVGKVAGEDVS